MHACSSGDLDQCFAGWFHVVFWHGLNSELSTAICSTQLENVMDGFACLQEELGLPLVSMAPRDVVLGGRKIILSLVYQLMRYHTMQLLQSIHTDAAYSQSSSSNFSTPKRQPMLQEPGHPAADPLGVAGAAAAGEGPGITGATAAESPAAAAAARAGSLSIRSSSKKQGRQLAITENDILKWANAKLGKVKPLMHTAAQQQQPGVAATAPTIRSFKVRGQGWGEPPYAAVLACLQDGCDCSSLN
jgi:hypothetical protein